MALDDDIALLERIPVLEVLGREALRNLAIGAESRILREGDILFREGEDADGAYVVVAGELVLKNVLNPMREEYVARAGTMIGEMALMTETRRTATAVAREQAAVLRIPRNVFLRMLEAYPAVARTLQGMMEERLAETMKGIGRVQRKIETIDRTPVRPEWA